MTQLETKSLPENAYQPMADGEIYLPIVPADSAVPKLTPM